MKKKSSVIVGGGAAGFFAALSTPPGKDVALLEKTSNLLSKVKISGGGRCNVTHACFDPKKLITFYPRGGKELLGPFHRFQPKDTVEWFQTRGCELKEEKDGRIFPTTDTSQTVINTLLQESQKRGVSIHLRHTISHIEKIPSGYRLSIEAAQGETRETFEWETESLILASGSSRDGHALANLLGHTIIPPVPSLFTFHLEGSPFSHLSGVSLETVEASLLLEGSQKQVQKGPLLLTHVGLSGPVILRLSAWGARELHAVNYNFPIGINWIPELSLEEKKQILFQKQIQENPFRLPKSLWQTLSQGMTKPLIMAEKLHKDRYQVIGKALNKEEFVTCGGVFLKEIDFKTMESKLSPSLFFAGEILDIDGITGGFNFQNAWTTGFLAGSSC